MWKNIAAQVYALKFDTTQKNIGAWVYALKFGTARKNIGMQVCTVKFDIVRTILACGSAHLNFALCGKTFARWCAH
jgi:hypothetical protein